MKPPIKPGNPDSFIILIVFLLYIVNKNIIKAIKKKNDLKNKICHTVACSNNLIIKPPQLKQNPPNKSNI